MSEKGQILTHGTGAAAAGATVTPANSYANVLIENGLWALNYADWIRVIGTIYLLVLMAKMVWPSLRWMYSYWFK